ncbi:hypothetical protein SKAU_G00332860 [Synaphobranchus kaupii]|uniref:CAP-Gly domain-containing protein n=1 Tax=Synaphobranchus kaupii TaxID=118154 RepID=A0A9Q1IHR1_SYNKA|nr:hypothetical protein SKAU_G00332860 [Synaphobranchus kaupii]
MTKEDVPESSEGDSVLGRHHSLSPDADRPIVHQVASAPMPSDCEFSFFDPSEPQCREVLLDPATTVPELFAVLRQWVPQVQKNIILIGNEILKRGCGVNDRDGLTDMSLLHYTCKAGAPGIGDAETAASFARQLLCLGAVPGLRSRWTNMNALHYAAYFDVPPLISVVLQASQPGEVDATCSDFDFGTALHISASNLCLSAARCLLSLGANPAFRNEKGQCPVDVVPEPLDMPLEMADAAALAKELRALLKDTLPQPCAPILSPPHWSPLRQEARTQLSAMGVQIGDPRGHRWARRAISDRLTKKKPLMKTLHTLGADSQRPATTDRLIKALLSFLLADVCLQRLARCVSAAAQTLPVASGLGWSWMTQRERTMAQWPESSTSAADKNTVSLRPCPKSPSCRSVAGTPPLRSSTPLRSARLDLSHVTSKVNTGVLSRSCSSSSSSLDSRPGPASRPRPHVRQRPPARIRRERAVPGSKTTPPTAQTPAGTRTRTPSASSSVCEGSEVRLGERVLVVGQRTGVVRFYGKTSFAPGFWLGVELDKPSGKNNGSVGGVQYFSCPPKHGVFAPPTRVQRIHGSLDCLSELTSSRLNRSFTGIRRSFSTSSAISTQREQSRRSPVSR